MYIQNPGRKFFSKCFHLILGGLLGGSTPCGCCACKWSIMSFFLQNVGNGFEPGFDGRAMSGLSEGGGVPTCPPPHLWPGPPFTWPYLWAQEKVPLSPGGQQLNLIHLSVLREDGISSHRVHSLGFEAPLCPHQRLVQHPGLPAHPVGHPHCGRRQHRLRGDGVEEVCPPCYVLSHQI